MSIESVWGNTREVQRLVITLGKKQQVRVAHFEAIRRGKEFEELCFLRVERWISAGHEVEATGPNLMVVP